MADNECNCEGIDNGDGIDQCIVWPCREDRAGRWGKVGRDVQLVPTLHCVAHQGFTNVEQAETDGS